MEGHPRHSGTHASAVVLSAESLNNIAPVDARNGVLMLDKKDADKVDLLKVDVLGLTQLSILEDSLEYAKLPQDTLTKLPLDDKSAFTILHQRKYSGIFQFNGPALRSLAVQFDMDRFDDIVAITALARPGPLASGNSNRWIKRRIGEEPVTYPHPIFEPYMKDTLGIIFYQEQVLEIGREVGGLSWPEVTKLRQIMSKSLGKEYFDRFGKPWKAGAQKRGVPKDVVDQLWDDMCAYGSWAFNKAHAVSYGLISYWCCWMKSNYPFEFAAATLNHVNLVDRQRELLREMVEEGYKYRPYDPEHSANKWTIADDMLIGPLQNIKGIGPKLSQTILASRARGDKFETLPAGIRKKLTAGVTPLDDLYPIRAGIKRVCPNLREANIVTPPTPIGDIEVAEKDFEVVVLCSPTKINIRHENEAVLVAKRGYERTSGPMESLNLRLTDDSGTVFGKVSRFHYARLGRPIVKRGRPGKSLWCIKGLVKASKSFKILLVNRIMYLGDMEDKK